MKLKKLAALLMAALTVMSLAACTTEESGAPADDKPSQSQGQGGTDKTGDKTDGQDGDKEPAEKKTLIVGTSADFAPYEFHKMVDGEDKILGFDIALAQKIADEMGAEIGRAHV